MVTNALRIPGGSLIGRIMVVYTHVVGDSEREPVGVLAEPLEDPLIGLPSLSVSTMGVKRPPVLLDRGSSRWWG
ncbi:hypothetical protein ACGFX8_30720 [Streptomyces sp. NPDC048362]|uniref:hypothetical protein n=1 Tax=Streptomyces sp. NPDC048362 TaxID=3365539 RepID=UPI003715119B